MMETVHCDLCGSADAREVCTGTDRLHAVTRDSFSVVRCRGCGLLYTNPRPDRNEIKNYYPSQSYYAYQVSPQRFSDRAGPRRRALEGVLEVQHGFPGTKNGLIKIFIKRLLAFLSSGRYMGYPSYRTGSRVLDVGCGNGFFLEVMKNYGIEARGIEIDGRAVSAGRDLGLTVTEGALESVSFPDGSFDCVRVGHVLEHLASPGQSLRITYGLLAANGEIIVLVPNAASMVSRVFGVNWFHLDLPRHFYHFTPETICRYLESAGFADIRIRRYTAEQSFLGSLDYSLRPLDSVNSKSSSVLTNSFLRMLLIPFVQSLNILGFGDLMEVRGVKAI